jgi:Tfp pilus assembly protein PilF
MSEMSVASINERAADEYFKRGQDALTQGQQEKAVEFFERALNENPDHESCRASTSRCFMTAGRKMPRRSSCTSGSAPARPSTSTR